MKEGGWTERRRGREGRLLRVSDFEGSDGCRPNKKKKKKRKKMEKRERERERARGERDGNGCETKAEKE